MFAQIRLIIACLFVVVATTSCVSPAEQKKQWDDIFERRLTRVRSHYKRVVPLVKQKHIKQCRDKFPAHSGLKLAGVIRPSFSVSCMFVVNRFSGIIGTEWDKNSPIAVFAAPTRRASAKQSSSAGADTTKFYWCKFMKKGNTVVLNGTGVGLVGYKQNTRMCGLGTIKRGFF